MYYYNRLHVKDYLKISGHITLNSSRLLITGRPFSIALVSPTFGSITSTNSYACSWKWAHRPHPRRLAAYALTRLSSINRHLDTSVTFACFKAWCMTITTVSTLFIRVNGRTALPQENTRAGACTGGVAMRNHSIRGRRFGPLYLKFEARVVHASKTKYSTTIMFLQKGKTYWLKRVSQTPYLALGPIDVLEEFVESRVWL